MDVVIALHAAAAVLLVAAGAAKLARPGPAADLVATLGLPSSAALARAIGAGEISLGVAALGVGGSATAVATGIAYSAFTVVVTRALMVGAESCGCFGRADAPPSWIHIVGNVTLAVLSFIAASSSRTPVDVMDAQPAGGVGFVALVGVIAGLALVAFTALPEALAARRAGNGGAPAFGIDPSPD